MKYDNVQSTAATSSLQWRHKERNGVSHHQPIDCLLKHLFRHRWEKTSKLRVTGRCVGNSPVTSEFPAERASDADNVSIWWRHYTENNINTLRPRQNGRHFQDDIFKWIFLNENAWISINISLKFVPGDSISNIPTLVQVMAWRRPGDKPLSEPMMVRSPTHICVTRPQWVNTPAGNSL